MTDTTPAGLLREVRELAPDPEWLALSLVTAPTSRELIDAVRVIVTTGQVPTFAAPADAIDLEWLLELHREAQRTIDRIDALQTAWLERVAAWAEHQSAATRRVSAWAEGLLEDAAIAERIATKDRTKRLSLPSGYVQTRATQPKYEVVDSDALIAWAGVHDPDGIVHSYPMSALRKVVRHELWVGGWLVTIEDLHDTESARESFEVREDHPSHPDHARAPHVVGEVIERGQIDYGVVEVLALLESVAIGPDGKPVPGIQAYPPDVTANVTTFNPEG